MKSPRTLTLLVVLLVVSSARALAGNAVIDWNRQALDATRLARNPPPHSALYLATYHIAIFDAVNGIEHKYHGWLVNDVAPAGANEDAAVASASITVLNALWTWTNPRTLQVAYDKALADIPDGQAKSAGLAWGKKVAEAVLAKRADSGFNKPIPGKYSSTEVGKWRETPSAFRPPTLPFWGKVTPFVIPSAQQFRSPPPYTIGSKEYADEIAYVNKVGARDGADRTEYQTLTTPFWSDDLGTATPPGHWNVVAEDLAKKRGLSVLEAARLFALLNIAEADSGIVVWDTKFFYSTWRPETAIREMDAKVNPVAAPNPDFIPNLPSPSFPAYISGHSAFSASAARTLALFFGTDDIPFSVGSDGLPGVVHHFDKLSDGQREAGMSRVFGGIHTMSDNLEGQKAGMAVADWVYTHALLPDTR
jgi:PAP2 superfamily/Vanadium chloroperoxidase N-terminal domain